MKDSKSDINSQKLTPLNALSVQDFVVEIKNRYACNTARIISQSNNLVYSLDDKLALKLLSDCSTDNKVEHRISQISHHLGKQFVECGVVQIEGVSHQYDISVFQSGTSLDKVPQLSLSDLHEILAMIDGFSEISLEGFGKISPESLKGTSDSWTSFLRAYMDRQITKGDRVREEFGESVEKILNEFESLFHVETGVVIPMDLNKRNFLKGSEGISLVNMPVVWSGDKLAAYGEFLAHFYPELSAHDLQEFFGITDEEIRKVFIYCFLMLFTTLAFVEKTSRGDFDIKSAKPWGSETTFYSLLQTIYEKIYFQTFGYLNKVLIKSKSDNHTDIFLSGMGFRISDSDEKNHEWYKRYFSGYSFSDKNSEGISQCETNVSICTDQELFEEIGRYCETKLKEKLNDHNFYCHGDSGELIIYQQDDELENPSGYFIIVSDRNYFAVSKRRTNEDRYTVARLLRTSHLIESLNQGDSHLHASAIEKDGKAYVFVGDKGTGKTTTLLFLLKHLGINFISNDHVIVDSENQVSGPPYSIGIRLGTLKHFHELLDFNGEYYISQPLKKDPKKYFHTYELVNIFGGSIKQNVPLTAIISLKKSDIGYMRPISDLLIQSKNIRDNLVTTPNEHQTFWDRYVSLDASANNSKRISCEGLFYEIGWNPYCQEESVELFQHFITSFEGCSQSYIGSRDIGIFNLHKVTTLIKDIHLGKKRKGGGEMWEHALHAMETALYYYPNNPYIALLAGFHDALEEFNPEKFTREEIEEMIIENFGSVLGLRLLKDLGTLTICETGKTHDEIIAEMLEGLAIGTKEARIVKIIDRICNLRGMEGFSEGKILRYIASTQKIIDVCKNDISDDILKKIETLLKKVKINII